MSAREIPVPRRLGRHSQEVPVHLLWNIIVLIVVGLIAGFIARAVIPGKQHMSVAMTIVLGIIGSLVGNFLASLIFHGDLDLGTSGIIGSIVGAVVGLGIYVPLQGRSHPRVQPRRPGAQRPDPPPPR